MIQKVQTFFFILCYLMFSCTSGVESEQFKCDIKIPVSGSNASEAEAGSEIVKTYDNDRSSVYHSRWNKQTKLPVSLSYEFKNVDKIDYLTIYPRSEGSNGNLGRLDIFVTTTYKAEYLHSSFDFEEKGIVQTIPLNVEKPLTVKLLVYSGTNNYVSFSEIEFYKSNAKPELGVFTDYSFSKLKDGVKSSDVRAIKNPLLKSIAEQLYNNSYEGKEYKIQEYKAILSPKVLANTLKLNDGYSRYENITGIVLEKGENIVMVGNTGGKSISLLLPDLMRQPTPGYEPTNDPKGWGLLAQIVPLKEGVNMFEVEKTSNAYICYFDNQPESCPKITVHFPKGIVNGYFDIDKHNNSDWDALLSNAKSPIMDAKGKYIHLAYPVEFLKQFATGKGVELVQNYDKMLKSHYTMMGLVKYNKIPTNRIFARVNFNYYMFRDGDGVAYLGNAGTMKMVADPQTVINGDPCWGFCHETGHVLQMIPQMTWGGMMEVSNNILTLYTTTGLGNISRLAESGAYVKARKSIIGGQISYLQDKDVFNRLVPFWQLQLYFSRKGMTDLYADVMEKMRNSQDVGERNQSINNQFEFIKMVCDVAQTDLTDFFEKWGFFKTGNINVEDYGDYNFIVSKSQVNEIKAYIAEKKYPKPNIDITTIED